MMKTTMHKKHTYLNVIEKTEWYSKDYGDILKTSSYVFEWCLENTMMLTTIKIYETLIFIWIRIGEKNDDDEHKGNHDI